MKAKQNDTAADPSSLACLRFGWASVAAWMAMGLAFEGLHLVKAPWYLESRLRRELWTLAHAHGALLGLLTVVYGVAAPLLVASADRRVMLSRLLRAGAVLLPAGFLFGGIGNAEGDPSLAIVLSPLGALLALAGVAGVARDAFRTR